MAAASTRSALLSRITSATSTCSTSSCDTARRAPLLIGRAAEHQDVILLLRWRLAELGPVGHACVDVDRAHVVDDGADLQAFRVGEEVLQQRGLPCSEEAREDGHRDRLLLHYRLLTV